MNLVQALRLFEGVERDFVDLWAKATTLARMGALSVAQRRQLHALRDSVHSQQWWLVELSRRVVARIPGAAERIPNPQKFPDLPPTGSPQNTALAGARGLGAVPVVLVVAAIILGIIGLVAGAWVLAENWETTLEQQNELYAAREAIAETRRRFNECVARGGDVAACSAAHPIPVFRPRATAGDPNIPGWAWAVMGIGAGALFLGGLYIWGASSAPRVERGIYALPRRIR